MNTEDRLTKACMQLTMSHSFWATFVLGVPRVPVVNHPKITTGATDGNTIWFNPDFVDTLSDGQLKTFMTHEAEHIFNTHHLRQGNRRNGKFNRAGDYALNGMLAEAGFEAIEGWLLDAAYTPFSAEKIYELLPDHPEDENNDPGGCGGFVKATNPDGTPLSQSQVTEAMEAIKLKAQQALANAKARGQKVPDMVERAVRELCEPVMDWREIISRFFSYMADGFGHEDYSWLRPSRRCVGGVSLPGIIRKGLGRVLLAVDTSGSVTGGELRGMVSECAGCAEYYSEYNPLYELLVLYCDDEVRRVERLTADGPAPDPAGGGCTDYSPVMDWILSDPDELEGARPDGLIYMTDGCCDGFGRNPGIPVLWVLTERNPHFEPPFGEVCILREL